MCAVGDNVMDRYLATGYMYPGGGAVNVAVHARRAGAVASYVGLVGDDIPGDLVLETLRAEGIETSRVRRVAGPNAATDVSINESGERVFDSHRTVDASLELTSADLVHVAGFDWLYTNYSSDTERLVPQLAARAPLAFDFSYKDEVYAQPLLPYVTLAAFSRSSWDEQDCLDLIRRTQASGPKHVIVTRGANGAVIGAADAILRQPAIPVTVVDTLGAGDAFLARYACGVLGTESPSAAAAAAARAAAGVCAIAGAFGHPYPLTHASQERDELGTRS